MTELAEATPRKRGPASKGVVEQRGDHLFARMRLKDGTLSRRHPLADGMTREAAVGFVAAMQENEDRTHQAYRAKLERERAVAASQGKGAKLETVDAWHARFTTHRGTAEDKKNAGKFAKWVSPIIGGKPMAEVTRDQIEEVRDHLDKAQRAFHEHGRGEGRIMPKTAAAIWSLVTTAFKQACSSKERSLRVRGDNPCNDVQPPDKGESRMKAWLYPKEIAAVLACGEVPLEWRELYAVASYTYLRPRELAELRWSDLDLENKLVAVSRAWEWVEKKIGPPKTKNGIRRVPIAPPLLPLLTRMREGKAEGDLVFPWFLAVGENKAAPFIRTHLALAKVTAARLSEDSATRMPVGFRSLRDSGLTWLALSGTPMATMMRRAGHDSPSTTMNYLKEVEDLSVDGLGEPFGPLPKDLAGNPSTNPSTQKRKGPENRALVVPAEGFEPPT